MSFALYSSISFVSFRASGYSFSSIALLNSSVRMGARKGARSFIIVGLILYMSLALFLFIAFSVFSTCSLVVWWSMKCGAGAGGS